MSILIDGVELPNTTDVNLDGENVERIVMDGTVVWRKSLRWTGNLAIRLAVTCNSVSTNSTYAVKKVIANFTMTEAPCRWRIHLYADNVSEGDLIGSTSDISAGVLTASITAGQTSHMQHRSTITFIVVAEYEDRVTGAWGALRENVTISTDTPYTDTTLNLEEVASIYAPYGA